MNNQLEIKLPEAPRYEDRRSQSYPSFFQRGTFISIQVNVNPSPIPSISEPDKEKTCCEKTSSCLAGFIHKVICGR